MSASKLVLSITGNDGQVAVEALTSATPAFRATAAKIKNLFKRLESGAQTRAYTVEMRTQCTAASGTVTVGTASGTVTATINGVAISVTADADDTITATLLAAAINASTNALVKNLVTATAAAKVVTVTAVIPGKIGNCITLAASGTGMTANGARLVSGAETRYSYSL